MLRPYQSRIVDAIGRSNAIVKMPTGSGKTIIAAEVIKRHHQQSHRRASLILVPTQDLVDQQSRVVENWCSDLSILRFIGGMVDPSMDEITDGSACLVSTPQAFLKLQDRRKNTMGWTSWGLVVFDEVHHVLKEHPYRRIALRLKAWNEGNLSVTFQHRRKVQIIGLSASLTYAAREAAITSTLDRLCRELSIETMESPSIEELEHGGYVSQNGRNVSKTQPKLRKVYSSEKSASPMRCITSSFAVFNKTRQH